KFHSIVVSVPIDPLQLGSVFLPGCFVPRDPEFRELAAETLTAVKPLCTRFDCPAPRNRASKGSLARPSSVWQHSTQSPHQCRANSFSLPGRRAAGSCSAKLA